MFNPSYRSLPSTDRGPVCRNGTGTVRGTRRWEEPEELLTNVGETARLSRSSREGADETAWFRW